MALEWLRQINWKSVLERISSGIASEEDRRVVRSALVSGRLVTGERAVAIGGDASDVIIVTGDNDVVLSLKGADATTIQEVLGAIVPTRLHELPSAPRDFTGRENEIAELSAKLEQGGVTISALHGLGGIGKTALALKLADQLKSQYPDAQFFLDLKGTSNNPLTVAEAMAHVIRAYHPTAKVPDIEADVYGLYRSVLQDQRALLLMDNAASAEQVEPLIPPESCVLLVTSRRHFTLPGLFAKNLEALSPEDANKLLLTIAPRIDEQADEIARLCGYLPLALRLAGSALMKFSNLAPTDYVQRLRDSQSRLQLIEASLNLSYELLNEELQKWWRLLAVFPDTFEERAAAAVWNLEVGKAQEVLGELIAASIVEWDESTRRYRLHDLARVFADSRLGTDERADAKQLHAGHYQMVLAVAEELYLAGGGSIKDGLALFDLEWRNIQAGQLWAQSGANEQAAKLCIAYPNSGAYILNLRQHPREQISWLEVALWPAQRLKERHYEANILGDLGIAYANVGEFKQAIKFFEQTLLICREIGHRRGEGTALGSLGNTYANLGETRRAIQFHEQYLVITREIGNRRGEGSALASLGFDYANLGEMRLAIEFYEQSLAIAQDIGDRGGEGNALGNLGNAYANLGETKRAVEFHEQHLAIAIEIGDRRGEGITMGSLGNAYAELGETKQAIEFYDKQLEIAREIAYRPGECNALGNLGNGSLALGETRRAIRFYEQALLIDREIGDRRGEAALLGNLGLATASLGEIDRAFEFFEQQLAIVQEIGDRRGEATALFNKSMAQNMLGEQAAAITAAEEALAIFEQIEDPNAAKVCAQLSAWRT